MRRAAAAGAVLLTALATPAWAATVDVRVGSFFFDDASGGDGVVAADAGDILRFAFDSTHSATVDGVFDSGRRGRGETYTSPPLKAGRYTLYCTVHGEQQHSARLVVQGGAAPSPSRASSPSPSPSRTAAASPRPVTSPTAASAAPKPSLKPSPSPSLKASPSPSPSVSVIAAPALPSTAPPPTADSPRPSESAGSLALPDADSRSEDDGTNWLLPAALLLLIAGLVATAIGLRRRGAAE